jgi:hypothetical protein
MTRGFLSPADVSGLVPGVTVGQLQELRKKGRGPRYYKPTPKLVVYLEADVVRWVMDSAVGTRDQS